MKRPRFTARCACAATAVVLAGAVLSCAPMGRIPRETVHPENVVETLHAALLEKTDLLARAGCTPVLLLTQDLRGNSESWLAAIRDSLALRLEQGGWTVFTRHVVGPSQRVTLIAEGHGDPFILRLRAENDREIAGLRVGPPPFPPGVRQLAGRGWVAGPWVPWEVLDMRVMDRERILVLSPDAIRLVGFSIGEHDGRLTLIDHVPLPARRPTRTPDCFALIWMPEDDPDPEGRRLSTRVQAPWLERVLEVRLSERGRGDRLEVRAAPTDETRIGGRIAFWDETGVGLHLEPAISGASADPVVAFVQRESEPTAFVAVDRAGRLLYGDGLGLWAPPAPGYGSDIAACDGGWIATADNPGSEPDALIHLAVDEDRHLRVLERLPAGIDPVRRLEAADLDGDGLGDLLIVQASAGGSRFAFLLSSRGPVS